MVTVVWETWLKQGSEDEGLALTHRIRLITPLLAKARNRWIFTKDYGTP